MQQTLRLRRRTGDAHGAPLEGGGRRLPLLPRARPRSRRAAAELIDAFGRGARVAGGSDSRASSPALDLERATVLVTGGPRPPLGRDPRSRRGRRRGGERHRQHRRRRRSRPDCRARRRAGEARGGARAHPTRRFDDAIAKLADPGFSADPYRRAGGRPDTGELGPIVDRILEENPGQVEAYRGGKEGLLGFFVGQVMKETGGKANARVVSDLVREKLAG